MGNIYSNASNVVVWLGPSSHDSSLAVETLKSIGRDVEWVDENLELRVKAATRIAQIHNDNLALREMEQSWVAIRELITREWFTRLWIFQEIGLAKNATVGSWT